MDELRIFTIIKKLLICFNVYRLLHTNNLNPFFKEINVSLNKTIIRYYRRFLTLAYLLSSLWPENYYSFQNRLNEGKLIKNDKSTTDLTTELTSICDQHKLIATNGALTLFKYHKRNGKLHRTTRNIWSFPVSSTNQFFFGTLRRMVKIWHGNFVATQCFTQVFESR